MGNLTLNLLNSTVCSKVLRCLLLLATVLISTRIISASEVRIVESAGIYYELTDGAFSSAQQKFAGTAKVVCPQNDPSLTYNITTAIIPQFVTDPAGAKYLVTDISEAAFYNCVSLKTVSIPANVTQIEYNAFLYCRNIVTFRIERSTTPLIIGKQIFDGQRLDKHDSYAPLNFYIGRPLSVSGDASLLCQTNTVKCEIEGVTHLTSEYITGCRSLKELTLYTGLESVDNISGCASLTYLEIPEGVVRLGTQAPDGGLQRLSALNTVRLPSTLTEISSFVDSELLTDIYLYAMEPPAYLIDPLSPNPYPDSGIAPAAHGTLHVPEGCRQNYLQNAVWHDPRYNIVADLQPIIPDNRIPVTLESSGHGVIKIISLDGNAYPSPDYEIEVIGNKIMLPSHIKTISVAAVPDPGSEPQSLYAQDHDDNPLPAIATSYQGTIAITADVTESMTITALFQNITSHHSTLHLLLPVERDNTPIGYPSINIPYSSIYRLYYTTTPGYDLSAVYLDNTEIIPQINSDNYYEDISDNAIRYTIDVPPYEGIRTLRIIEKSNNPLGIYPIDTSTSITQNIQLIYDQNRAAISGLPAGTHITILTPQGQTVYTTKTSCSTDHQPHYLPANLKGLHIIHAGPCTFKVIL